MTDTTKLIARAEASLKDVTPGPWEYQKDGNGVRRIFGRKGGNQIATVSIFADWQPVEQKKIAHKRADQNAHFIAASRQLVHDLIAALRATEARAERAESHAKVGWDLARHWQSRYEERVDASAALDRIKQEAADEALEWAEQVAAEYWQEMHNPTQKGPVAAAIRALKGRPK